MADRRELLPELTSYIENQREPRILVDLEYRILAANHAYREAYEASGSVIGRRCYEVSHHFTRPCDEAGETCPRRLALSSGQTQSQLHIHYTPRGEEHVEVELHPVNDARGEVRFFVERVQSVPTARATASADGLIGRSSRFREMLELVARVAPTETSVLLLGETGTGKEMVTRLIHQSSRRATAPLAVVDCSSLTESLFESELFGHEKGAFTGAFSRQMGLVESASGGTLFLDEVGDIPLTQQVKLLRLLESGTYRRVGSVTPLLADFRLVAATHRDLPAMVRAGSFRSDLYYRISAYPIAVPPLRERREDIAMLAKSLLERLYPKRGFTIAADAQRALSNYDYPGNVRELRNIIERASLLASDLVIRASHLPWNVASPGQKMMQGTVAVQGRADPASLDAETLARAVASHRGDRPALAAALGVSERTLYRRLRAAGLARKQRE